MPADSATHEEDASSRSGAGAYGDYLAEREEILRHKWIMSEAAGRDMGFEAALLDWVHHHRAAWRRLRTKGNA